MNINKLNISSINFEKFKRLQTQFLTLNEISGSEDQYKDNSLYLKIENGATVLYFNGEPLKAGEWEIEEGSEDILITRDTAKNLNLQNKNISNVEDLSTDSITLNNDESITTQTKIYKNGGFLYYGNERLNDNTHGLWEYDNVSETRLRPKTNSSGAYPNLELKDKAIQGLLQAEFKHQATPINSTNAGYALLYNIQPSGNYSKPYLYLDNKPVSPFRYYLEPSDQSDTYTSQYGLNMSGNFLENIENLSTTANSENLINGTSTTINSPLIINGDASIQGGGSITGQNTFTIGNTTLNLGSAFTNLTSAVNFKNSSICNLENGNEFYVYNQEKFYFYESDWVNLVGPANALNFYEVWDGNQFFSNRSEGFKNKDAHQNFGHYLYAYKMFNRIQERDSPNRYVMSVIGFLDGETTNGVVARPLFKFQSSDNYNNDGGSLPSGKSCVEMDRASVNIMFTSPRIIASKIKCNEIIANNLQTDDFFDFINDTGDNIASIVGAIGGVAGAVITAGGVLAGGLLVGAGVGVAGVAMGGSSRDPTDPTNTSKNKILYAGDNGALWNAAFWGRTNFGTNTLNYLTHAPIGMVLDPTNNNLLYDTLTNRDQLWKFGVNHLSQTFAVNMVGLTTDYGLSTTAFNQTDIFSNTIPGAYGNDYPCFAYEPIMGRSHGQELCSIAIKNYLDFDTATYLNVNTRNYETVPKTNRLYCENGDLHFNGIITQNKVNNLGDNEFILNTAGDREQQFILNNDADTTQQRKIELILKQGSNVDEFRFNTLDNSFNPIGGDLIVGNSANIELRHNLTTLRTNTDVRETLYFKDPSTGHTQGGLLADDSLDALKILGRVQGDPDYTLEEKMRIGSNFINIYEPTYHQFDMVMNVQNRGIMFKDASNNNLLLTYSTSNNRLEFDGQPIGGGGGGGNEDKYFTLASNTATSASGINKFEFNSFLEIERDDANDEPLAVFNKPANASDSSIEIKNGFTNAELKMGVQYYEGSWRNLILSDGGVEGQSQGNPRLTLCDSRYKLPNSTIRGIEITDRLKLLNSTSIDFDSVFGVENIAGDHLLTRGNDNLDGDNLYFNGNRILTAGNALDKNLTKNETVNLNNYILTFSTGDISLTNASITIPDFVPSNPSNNKLYAVGNELYFAGNILRTPDKYFTQVGSVATTNQNIGKYSFQNSYIEIDEATFSNKKLTFVVDTAGISKINTTSDTFAIQRNQANMLLFENLSTLEQCSLFSGMTWSSGRVNKLNFGNNNNRSIVASFDEGLTLNTNLSVNIGSESNNTRYYKFKTDNSVGELESTYDDFQIRTTAQNVYKYRDRIIPGQSFGADYFIETAGSNIHMGCFQASQYESFVYTTQFRIAFGTTNGGNRYTMENGTFTIPGTMTAFNYVTTSDERIKKNIRNLDDDECLNIVKAIEPKKYGYIDHHYNDQEVVGFIAQDLEPHIPSAVETNEGYLPRVWGNVNVSGNIFELLECDTTELNVGDKIDIAGEGIKEGTNNTEVLEIIDNNKFKVNYEYEVSRARVLGVIVEDKKQVKLNRLIPVLWSATQKLINEKEDLNGKIHGLISVLTEKEVEITSLNNKIQRIEKILLNNNLK